MTPEDLQKAMHAIDQLTEHTVDIQKSDAVAALMAEGLKEPFEALRELEDAGLIQVEGNIIRKIAKRMFW